MEKGPCGALDPKMGPDYPTSRFFLTCVLGYGVGGGRISVRKSLAWGILEKALFKIGMAILGVDIVPGRFWGVGGVFLVIKMGYDRQKCVRVTLRTCFLTFFDNF